MDPYVDLAILLLINEYVVQPEIVLAEKRGIGWRAAFATAAHNIIPAVAGLGLVGPWFAAALTFAHVIADSAIGLAYLSAFPVQSLWRSVRSWGGVASPEALSVQYALSASFEQLYWLTLHVAAFRVALHFAGLEH